MSALVIIAHVKDGADLARQHHLPKPIIDFIEQHHGTTLVEFFYRKEAKKAEGILMPKKSRKPLFVILGLSLKRLNQRFLCWRMPSKALVEPC